MKNWSTPNGVIEQFVANDYVAACGDKGTHYKFECNAGNEYKHYEVYTDDGKNLTPGISYFHPCGATHEADMKDEFISGYMTYGSQRTKVIIWTDGGTNVHCTTNLDQNSWETAKS